MPHHSVGETRIIHKDNFAYISHPSIAVLQNGDWLASYNHFRRRVPTMHPPDDPLFRTLLSRSTDQGATWQAPVFAPNFYWYGTQCPGITQLSNGTVLLSEFQLGWHPLQLARKLKADGAPVAISLPSNKRRADCYTAITDKNPPEPHAYRAPTSSLAEPYPGILPK